MSISGKTLSVIVPVYNEEKNIVKLLDVFDSQTLSDFDVIIIDDGSTDNTLDLVKSYAPTNYSLIILDQINCGAAKARQHGILTSKREYIAVIDCDDSLATDSLYVTLSRFISDDIDISLFNLFYVNTFNDIYKKFEFFTSKNTINGSDAFNNCIDYWGVHAFGIYRREVILRAYSLYSELNLNGRNYLNNDEVISRISFLIARKISIDGGDYYFIHNSNSTTRRINENYYKIINNSFYLLDFIVSTNFKIDRKPLVTSCFSLLVSTVWGVTLRYLKWSKFFSQREKKNWHIHIKKSLRKIFDTKGKYNIKISTKAKFQLFLLRIICSYYE